MLGAKIAAQAYSFTTEYKSRLSDIMNLRATFLELGVHCLRNIVDKN